MTELGQASGGKEKKEEEIKKEAAKVVLKEYTALPPEHVLAPSYVISEEETSGRVLELKSETHDKQMEELLGILGAKGISNAVSVARHLGPHIEDDFHRVLVQVFLGRIEDPGFSIPKAKLFRAINMVLYEIVFPQEGKKEEQGKTFKDFIAAMEQFYSSMVSVSISKKKFFSLKPRPKPYFSLEIVQPAVGEEIIFYVSVFREHGALLEKQLLAFFPQARLAEKKDDYNVFPPEGVSMGSEVRLKTHAIFPIKTYDKLGVDPLESFINAFSKIKRDGEGAALQVVISPAGGNFLKKLENVIKGVAKGEPLSKAMQGEKSLPSDLFEAVGHLFGGAKSVKKEEPVINKAVNEELMSSLKAKASRTVMLVNIRLIASAKTKEEASTILAGLKAAFFQLDEPRSNSIAFRDFEGRNLEKLFYHFAFRIFDEKDAVYLNTAELASIYHFPLASLSAPKVKYLKTKDAPPPANLLSDGLLIGKNNYRNEEVKIYMNSDDRRRHLYLIGQTGTGKSVLMQNLIIQDIKAGRGVCFIDPHGDAVKEILSHIPQERLEDVIYFDPADTERPMGLNMIDYDPAFPEQKTFIVNELLEIFNKLYNMSIAGGPMFEQYFRNATMLVMDDPEAGSTLLEIGRVLSDKEFRNKKLERCKNPVVKAFWKEVAEKAGGEFSLQNMVPYITSKFDTFLTNDIMRPIVAQAHSAFNFRQIMDEGKIFLINLSKGRLGDLNSNLIGMIMVGKLLMASLSRTDVPEDERRDFYLYIDEFQNVTTKSIATILSEARKYRLDLTIGHQFIGQLDEDIKKAVFGNVGSMIIFRVGADDIQILEKQVEPVFDSSDLLNIENYNAYVKLLVGGHPARPFNIRTISMERGNPAIAESARKMSSLKYGRPRELVEEEIRNRYASLMPAIME